MCHLAAGIKLVNPFLQSGDLSFEDDLLILFHGMIITCVLDKGLVSVPCQVFYEGGYKTLLLSCHENCHPCHLGPEPELYP